jgi:hypothetical protein
MPSIGTTIHISSHSRPRSQDVEYMWNDVSKALPVKPIVAPAPPPERVFLIHATEESNVRPDTVIFAWPPPRIRKKFEVEMDDKVIKLLGGEAWASPADEDEVDEDELDMFGRRRSELVPRMDGRYWAQDYAELMKHVELENKTGQPDAWGTFGKTSCTQRFQGGHLLTNEGVWRKIESVFIPYGKITFACFQTVSISPLGEASIGAAPQIVGPGSRPQDQIPWMPNVWPSDGSVPLPMPLVQGPPQLATFASGPSPMPSHQLPVDPLDRLATAHSILGPGDNLGLPILSPSTTQTVKPSSTRSPPPPTLPPGSFAPEGYTGQPITGYGYPDHNLYPSQSYGGSMSMGYGQPHNIQQMDLPIIEPKQPVYPPDLSDWAPQPIPLIRPPSPSAESLPMHNHHSIDPRGVKRKPYEMEDGNMIDGVDFEEQYMPAYPPPMIPLSATVMPPFPADQTASPIGFEYPQPVLMRGKVTLSEQQENDHRKKAAAAAVDKEPLRPAVPPPDGIECCIQCATKER